MYEELAMWLLTFLGLTAILSVSWITVEGIRAKHGYLHIEGHTEYKGEKEKQ
jgi:hypothetical protein